MATRDLSSAWRANLTDDDLRALGAIVSYWSLAEHALESIISRLVAAPGFDTSHYTSIRLISAKKKIDAFKRLLKLTYSAYPETRAIGLSLASTGNALRHRRKIAIHWPVSRGGANPAEIQFVDIAWPYSPLQRTSLTYEDLVALALDIADWCSDLSRFSLRLLLEGPLASLTTFHGPKPGLDQYSWEAFRTIAKGPQIPTIQKPAHQRPLS